MSSSGEIERRPNEQSPQVGEHQPDSTYRSSVFEDFSNDDAADLIAEYPLAWICPRVGDEEATLLPLLAERDETGVITRLIGHMARANPLRQRLVDEPRALILFQGPQAYVSPAVVGRRDWAPTWNFAQLRIHAEILFHDCGDSALALLVDTMEEGREHPWRVEEVGPRYRQMERSIIAFDANVLSLNGRFKLGQDETSETLQAICANHPDAELVRWMRRFNKERC